MPLKASAQKVQDALATAGFANRVIELPDSARTAAEAALALGCDVARIVKSLIFRARTSGRGVLVVASGANRVDENAVKALLGEAIDRPDADFVRERTGFAIGGICFVDEDLTKLDTVWAAAGHPHAVFELTPAELVQMTGGQVVSIAKR